MKNKNNLYPLSVSSASIVDVSDGLYTVSWLSIEWLLTGACEQIEVSNGSVLSSCVGGLFELYKAYIKKKKQSLIK